MSDSNLSRSRNPHIDDIAKFIRGGCDVGKQYKVTSKDLHAAWEHWCYADPEIIWPSGKVRFGEGLDWLGYSSKRGAHNIQYRFGLRVREVAP